MGQFKPMVKMMTTEPSVELKLKKGGKVEKKMQMGGLPSAAPEAMPSSMPSRGGMMPTKAPMRPPLAARRRAMAMPAGVPAPASPMPTMKKGGKAESKATHKAEMSKMKGLEKELKSHESKPASKGHKGLATGGVVNGQGGFKEGGIIKSTKGETKMVTSKVDHSPAKTGGVKMGNDGGYATGGVAKANGGGYKKGGSAKKAYATGGLVDTGKPVAMPQGRKKPSAPVSINQLSGTFKKGGQVKKAGGGEVLVDASKGAYEKSIGPTEGEMDMAKAIRNIPSKLYQGAKSLFTGKEKPAGSVTKTEKSVTVSPAKKRGGAVKC
jgi:hypothetical protein|tara:strand:+ start:1156 stop:2124 length:969 start_codon:yes stop_codon:yes gene_type:complete